MLVMGNAVNHSVIYCGSSADLCCLFETYSILPLMTVSLLRQQNPEEKKLTLYFCGLTGQRSRKSEKGQLVNSPENVQGLPRC